MAAVTICSSLQYFHYLPFELGIYQTKEVCFIVLSGHSLGLLIESCSSASSFSAIRVVLSAYLRLLIFLTAIFIPAHASSSPIFLMMYSAYKLNKQGDKIQPCCTPFPIRNQAVVPCAVLTVAS